MDRVGVEDGAESGGLVVGSSKEGRGGLGKVGDDGTNNANGENKNVEGDVAKGWLMFSTQSGKSRTCNTTLPPQVVTSA